MSVDIQSDQLTMNAEELYQEETFTDRKVGTIRRLTPITSDGDVDTSRPAVYLGQAQVMTPMGALPLAFEIEASSLEAIGKYGDGAKEAMERTAKELQEMRRQAASQIVVPGAEGGMSGVGAAPGKIQLR